MSAATPTGARALLYGERYGFAIDATTADTASAAYVGAPYGGTVAVHADNVTDKPNIPLDAAAGLLKGASPLVQSGTSAKMVHFPTSPYVRWSPHNYCLHSQAFDEAAWAKTNISATANDTTAPDGTATADKLTTTSNGTLCGVQQNVSNVPSAVSTYSVYIKQSSGPGWVVLYNSDGTNDSGKYFDIVNGTIGGNFSTAPQNATITDAGNGWWLLTMTSITFTASTTLHPQIYIATSNGTINTANTGDAIYAWGGQINRGYTANPHLTTTTAARIGIPQSYDAAEAMYGILVEPAGTNKFLNSEALATSASTLAQTSWSSNATTAPDGSTTADKLVEDGTNNVHGASNSTDLGAGPFFATLSVYCKQAEKRYVSLHQIYTVTPAWGAAIYDLETATVTDTQSTIGSAGWPSSVSATITAVGDGWFRLTLTANFSVSSINKFGFALANAPTGITAAFPTAYAGNSSDGCYFWGAQMEAVQSSPNTIATSYIPTLGSTVTRAGDQVEFAHASWPFSTTAETIYMDLKDPEYSAGHFYSMMGSGAPGSPILLGSGSTVYSGTEISWLTPPSSNTRFQGTSVHKSGDNANSAQGGAVQTNSSVQALATNGGQTGFAAFGSLATHKLHVYRYVVVPRRVTDADLPTWRYEA